jgi:Flp pilus assembly protein TadD
MLIAAALLIGKVEHARAGNESPQPTAWTWRSTTIQERVNYMRVGAAMFRQSPVVGLGPGSVDLYFGRFKPADAREAKYLHNWVIQLAAETGAVGVSLAVLFLILVFWRTRGSSDISTRTPAIVAGIFIFDALLQLSFNHREIMALFGLCCGALLGSKPARAAGLMDRARTSFAALRLISLAAAGFVSLAIITLVVPRLVALDYRQRANDAIESADSPSAVHLLRLSQQWEPGHPGTYLSLAQLEEQNGQLSSALLLIEKAVRVQPESAAALAALAHVQARLRNFDQATSAMNEALVRYPTNPNYNGQMSELLLAYAKMENDAGRSGEAERKRTSALEYARKAAQFSPGVPGAEHWPAFYQQLLSTGAK